MCSRLSYVPIRDTPELLANDNESSKHQFENQYKGQFVWKPRFIDRDLFIEELIFFGLGLLQNLFIAQHCAQRS